MAHPIRVLVLTPWFPRPGSPGCGAFVHEQVRALRARGIEQRIINPLPLVPFPLRWLKGDYAGWAATPCREMRDGFTIDHPRYVSLPRRILLEFVGAGLFRAIRRQVRLLYRDWRFDVIHVHEAYPCGAAAVRLRDAEANSAKVLMTIHRTSIDDIPRHNRACLVAVRNALLLADQVVFVSRHGLQLGLDHTHSMIRHKSAVITNGVDPERFGLNPADRRQVNVLRQKYAGSFNLLFVGNIALAKGVGELLQAVESWAANIVSIRLLLVGNNLMGRSLDKLIAARNLQDRVEVVGPVEHDRIKIWMSFADALVLPSYIEGVPTVLFESLYLGLPSIFTRVGGIPYVVRDGEHALLIEPRSASAILQAVRQLCANPDLRKQLAQNGRKLVTRKYTWDANALQTIELYRNLLGGS